MVLYNELPAYSLCMPISLFSSKSKKEILIHLLENYPVTDETSSRPRYLDLKNFILDDIVWVDEVNGLLTATKYIEGCKIVGIDCEWKPNYEKGSKPNKVTFFLVESYQLKFVFCLTRISY